MATPAVDALLTAEEARNLWRSSNQYSKRSVDEALLGVHKSIQYDASRGHDDCVITDWRKRVPDSVTRRVVARILEEDLQYKVRKSGEDLVIVWRDIYASESDSD